MTPRADAVAHAVISQFDALPAKRKPGIRDNGLHEWVPLSGIVAEKDGGFTCLALAYAPGPRHRKRRTEGVPCPPPWRPGLRRESQHRHEVPPGLDRKSTRLNSSHSGESRMPSSA